MSPSVQQSKIETRLGAVQVTRAGRGAPLMLLHGNGHSWHEFEGPLPALASTFDVIAWDMPGQGESEDAPADASVAHYAAALGDVADALGVRRPAVLGSSIGAFIAAEFALQRAEVSAIILEEMQFRTPGFWQNAWPMVEKMFGNVQQAREQVQARFCRPIDDAFVAHWNAGLARAGAERLIGVMKTLAAYDVGDALARLNAPRLLLFGAKGPTVDRAAAMQAASPGAALHIIEDAGHFISIDQPDQFASAVTAFVKAHAPVAGAED